MSPNEALKKVDHHLIDFYPDIIFNEIQEELIKSKEWAYFENEGFGRKKGTEDWDNLKLAEFMGSVVEKYSRNIDSMTTARFVIDEQFKFTFKYFLVLFTTYMFTFFVPLVWFFLCRDKQQ